MAYDFNGSTQRLTISAATATAAPLTMACWFNADNTSAFGMLMNIASTQPFNSRYRLEVRGDVAGDPLRLLIDDNAGVIATADTTSGYSASTWTHACAVFASNSSRSVLINGGSKGTNTTTASPNAAHFDRLTIGAQHFSTTINAWFDGRIAEAGVWNAALTDAEIASLADGMTCDKVRPQSLVFYAPLVRDLIDYKGGLTITNTNTATVANHPRVYA
jgi:hypothetical protein